jgi:excisionase family DNA binding protein
VDGRPTILTVQEVARYLRVHTMTVYRMVQRGDLPGVRVGRGWRFKRDQIDRWLAEHETNSHRAAQGVEKRRRGGNRRQP